MTASIEEVEETFVGGLHLKNNKEFFDFYYDKSYDIVSAQRPLSVAEYYALKSTVSGNLRTNLSLIETPQFPAAELQNFADRIFRDNVLVDDYLGDILDNPLVLNYVLSKYCPVLKTPHSTSELCSRSLGFSIMFGPSCTTGFYSKLFIHSIDKDVEINILDNPTNNFLYAYNSQLLKQIDNLSEIAQHKVLTATEQLASLATQELRPDITVALEKFKLQKLVNNAKQSFVQKI